MKYKLTFPPPDLAYAIIQNCISWAWFHPGMAWMDPLWPRPHQSSHGIAAWAGCPAEPGRTWVSEPRPGERKGSSAGWGGREQGTGDTQHVPKVSLGTGTTESPEPTCLALGSLLLFRVRNALGISSGKRDFREPLHCCAVLLLLLIILEISVPDTEMKCPNFHAEQQ